MSYTKVKLGNDAFPKIESGVDQLCNIVKSTLGPAGKTVLIESEFGTPLATKDGVKVAMSIRLKDSIENMGAQTVKEVAIESNRQTGDGTTTASVLAQALVKQSFDHIKKGHVTNVNTFKKGMTIAMELAIQTLTGRSTLINNNEEGLRNLRKIAMISSNNDLEVTDLIMQAYKIIGGTGAVKIDIGKQHKSVVEQMRGMTFANGMISGYLAIDKERHEWSFKNTYVFATDCRITTLDEIENLLHFINEMKKPLLIICDDMDEAALRILLMNVDNGHLKVCVVRAPGFGSQKIERINDIAIVTGGQAVFKDKLNNLKQISELDPKDYLGIAGNVIVRKNEFSVIDGKGNLEDIEKHKTWIKSQIELEDDPHLKDQNAERLAKMTTGVALIYVGADSEIAAKEKKDRVDDALQAVKAAEEQGFVRGGGLALFQIGHENYIKEDLSFFEELLIDLKLKKEVRHSNYILGQQVFYRSLFYPMSQILVNAEMEHEIKDIDAFVRKSDWFTKGIDVFEGGYIDYLRSGIIDPTKVSISAIRNAVSICGTLITMSGVIYMESERQAQNPFQL